MDTYEPLSNLMPQYTELIIPDPAPERLDAAAGLRFPGGVLPCRLVNARGVQREGGEGELRS